MINIKIIKWDITNQNTEAIVNSANPTLNPWWWISGRIHQKAWIDLAFQLKDLLKEKNIWFIETWDAIISNWWNLISKYIIHTVWPKITANKNNWKELLKKCYISCMDLAIKNWIKSISFPSISTWIYWCPIKESSIIAIETVKSYLYKNTIIEEIRFVLFSDEDYKIYKESFNHI